MVDLSPAAWDPATAPIRWNTQPLRRYERAEPYPVHLLPPIIGEAVREVSDYVQAPDALIAASALSVVSASVQTRFSVERDWHLRSPASLYFLTIAESGERKSQVDRMFGKPLRDWEAQQAIAAQPKLAEYRANVEQWEIAGTQLKRDMQRSAYEFSTGNQYNPLVRHEQAKPKPPRVPKMLRGDDTPEALAVALQDYPVGAVISAEAGVIFGSHSMSPDTVVRNLGQANAMWDGGPIDQDRISRDRIRIETLRLTMGLQVQPAVMKNFNDKTKGLARGIGYLARFLFSQPESTQGTRYYREPPADTPALRAFHARVAQLLAMEALFDDADRLVSTFIPLDPEAHRCWSMFHDEVEDEIGGDHLYSLIKDVASKAAENAARIACCLHVFQNGSADPIGRETMADACGLMRWYLDEAVRYGRETNLTEELLNAELTEQWIVAHFRNPKREGDLTVNMVRQRGPNAIRGGNKLRDALDLLQDHGRLRVVKPYGNKREIIIPAPAVMVEYSR